MVSILAAIGFLRYKVQTSTQTLPYFSQEECETKTNKVCVFHECDYKCPKGFVKGWAPTLTSQANEIVNWKTFTSFDKRIQFKYPPNWFFERIDDSDNDIRFFVEGTTPNYTQSEEPGNDVLIVFVSHDDRLLDKIINIGDIKLDVGQKPGFINNSNYLENTDVVIKPDDVTMLNVWFRSKESQKYFDQILSTFEFNSDNSITNEVKAGKTYQNSNGYSVNIPQNFKTQRYVFEAGVEEAETNSSSWYIYKNNDREIYEDRYLKFDIFDSEPIYSYSRTEDFIVDNQNLKKLIQEDSNFDIYIIKLKNNSYLAIEVSNDPRKSKISNQIFNSLKFTK